MSSILKALKKVEDDKTVRRAQELNIDAEILRSDNSPHISSAGLLLVALLLLAGGSGATYIYLKPGTAPGLAAPRKAAAPLIEQITLPSASDVKTEQLPAAVVVVPANQQKTAMRETSKRDQPAVQIRKAPAAAVHRQAVLKSKPEKNKVSNLPPSSASTKEAPVIRVNGIAFEEGGADSVAMINGVAAASGSVVEGVKIEGIYKNRVKFSYNGESFEIQLGQSNR